MINIIYRYLGLRKGDHVTTNHKIMTSLAFSIAFLTAIATMPAARAQTGTSGAVVVTNGPQTDLAGRLRSGSREASGRPRPGRPSPSVLPLDCLRG